MTLSDIVPRRRRIVGQLVPFGSLQRQINTILDDFVHGLDLEPLGSLSERLATFNPKINVTENDQELRVTAELPGIAEKDVELTLTRDALTIRGEKREEYEKSEGSKQHFVESRYGKFERTIPLDFEVSEDRVQATFKNGVLTVALPKSQAEQKGARKISIKAE